MNYEHVNVLNDRILINPLHSQKGECSVVVKCVWRGPSPPPCVLWGGPAERLRVGSPAESTDRSPHWRSGESLSLRCGLQTDPTRTAACPDPDWTHAEQNKPTTAVSQWAEPLLDQDKQREEVKIGPYAFHDAEILS